ncbi:pentatricopeptide repeat-containing protein At5g15340, mitochondrial [Mercurialis annua]|uniref:pentatricopeptide repeat-containing protein At5g15340, mitochondrial n=1 Tax=Mercurialis annua TaxID=3986 RepID=UPI00215FA9EB|nr:pentatricopeptide repeat-containing protein At5g15340, mitochondrial [Mercurialis annua]
MICSTYLTLPLQPRYFRSLLRSCARQSALSVGQQLHAIILTSVVSENTFLFNALLHLYAQCGITRNAHYLFDQIPNSHKDTADWTSLLSCLTKNSPSPENAFSFFKEMRKQGVVLDDVALVCVFSLCARVCDSEMGRQAHGCLVKMGLGFNVNANNAGINMYVKCRLMSEARRVFSEMDERNVVTWSVLLEGVVNLEGVENGREVFDQMPERNEVGWTVMIAGYVGGGFCKEAFWLLSEMVLGLRLELNYVTLCSILSACAQSGDVAMGIWVHVYALKIMGREMGIMVGTALVDMYAKCGRITKACEVFRFMPKRNVVTWNAILGGLAMHGKGKLVLDLFPKMIEETRPDDLTFMAVLSAFSHSGLVDQGCHYFYNLESKYGITPKIEHYACMVDLLGRAGRFEEAELLIKQMPMPPNEVVLGSLLGSCNVHGKPELGERVMQDLLQMDPNNTKYHILLSNLHASSGKQGKANYLRQELQNKGIKKMPGMSSIHVNGQLHQFGSGDKSHSRTDEIYVMLDDMIRRLRLAGYIPNINCQVFSACGNTEELEEKEQALFSHSEKLALCFGLMSTRPGSSLYIFKNLRICKDCHSAMKIASEIYNREIVVRDRSRFHCFKQGSCSCSDYW